MHVFKHQIVTTAIYAHRGRSASHWLVWKPVVQFRWFCSLHRFRTRFILTSLKYDDDAYDNEKKSAGQYDIASTTLLRFRYFKSMDE